MGRIVSRIFELQDFFSIHEMPDGSSLHINFRGYPLIAMKGTFNEWR